MTAADRDAAFREAVAVFCEHGFKPEPERCPAGCTVATHNRFGEAVMSDHTADVATALAAHFWVCDDTRICACGWQPDDHQERLGDWDDERDHKWLDEVVAPAYTAHVAAALLASEPIAQALAAVEAVARVGALAETWERSGFATGRLHADDIRAALRPEGGKS